MAISRLTIHDVERITTSAPTEIRGTDNYSRTIRITDSDGSLHEITLFSPIEATLDIATRSPEGHPYDY